jgi:cobalamin synthase
MNYFKILGTVFGLVAMLKPFYMHLLPWDENKFIANAYSKKRPSWVVPVAIVGLLLVAFTWYKEITTDIQYSLVITVIFSLTAIKAVFFLFDYEKFQKWVAGMLSKDNGRQIVLVDILAGMFGLIILVASLLIY